MSPRRAWALHILAIPFIGLLEYARAVRSGLESKLAALIVHMTWSGKQMRLYLGLTIPFILICAIQSAVSAYLGDIFLATGGAPPGGIGFRAAMLFLNMPLAELVLAVAIGIGIRRFFHSDAYQYELRVTPNSRGELFQAAMAGYFPFLMFLYFVAQPVGYWIAQYAPWSDDFFFSEVFFGVTVSQGRYNNDLAVLAGGILIRLLGYFAFLLQVLFALFLIVRARTLSGGITAAMLLLPVLLLALSVIPSVAQLLYYLYTESLYMTSRRRDDSSVIRAIWLTYHLMPLLALGVVWHIAQRRFERGLLPLEEGFE